MQHFHAGAVYVCAGWVDVKFFRRVSCVYEGDAQGVNIRSREVSNCSILPGDEDEGRTYLFRFLFTALNAS